MKAPLRRPGRRDAIAALGAAALARPLRVLAQPPTAHTIGYLSPRSAEVEDGIMAAFRQGLGDTGYVEGANLRIEYRWAQGQYDRLPALAAELARVRVAVIATIGGALPVRAALAAAPTTPIVFISSDPVREGLIQNINRPEGTVTGFNTFTVSLGPKRLELLRELVPGAAAIGFLVNPTAALVDLQLSEVRAAAHGSGVTLHSVSASTAEELDGAFATLAERRVGALLTSADLFFQVERDRLVRLAARHAIPTMYEWPEFVVAGGLVSYSSDRREAAIQCGTYVGRLLNGARVADLPVVHSTRFTLTLNLRTARTLGLTVSQLFVARADEVIE